VAGAYVLPRDADDNVVQEQQERFLLDVEKSLTQREG
jgi:hypothetical protein